MEPIRHSLHHLIRQNQWEPRLKELAVFDLWKSAVGEQIAKSTTPVRINQGLLTVQVASSPWMNELRFHKVGIIRNLNDKLGHRIIHDIEFKLATWHKAPEKVTGRAGMLFHDASSSGRVNLSLYPITPEAERFAERIASHLEDEKLREALKQVLLTHSRMKSHLKVKGYNPCVRCGTLTGRKSGECYFCGKKQR